MGKGVQVGGEVEVRGTASATARSHRSPVPGGVRRKTSCAPGLRSVNGTAVASGLCSGCTALHQVNELLEMEATRIAHALHDESGQLLTLVHLKLAAAARQVPANCRPCFEEIRTLLDGIEMQLRRLSHELRPTVLDELGLAPALRFLAGGVSERSGIKITLEHDLARQFAPLVETALYRAVQEALTNISRHSRASSATISLQYVAGVLHCTVRDNGIGFNPKTHRTGLGLRSVRSRIETLGGSVSFHSQRGHGTVLRIAVPALPVCAAAATSWAGAPSPEH